MKAFIAALAFVSFSVHASPVNLTYTSSSDSVQAVLSEVLETYKNKMDSVGNAPFDGIKRDGTKLIVADKSDKVVCDGRQLGMAAVMSYSCVFSKGNYPWNMGSDSVAAILYDALYDTKKSNTWLSEYIYEGSNGELVLQDERSRLECKSGSPGMLAVQQYTCTVGTH